MLMVVIFLLGTIVAPGQTILGGMANQRPGTWLGGEALGRR